MAWHKCERWTREGMPCVFMPQHIEEPEFAEVDKAEVPSEAQKRVREITGPRQSFEMVEAVMQAMVQTYAQQQELVIALADGVENTDATMIPREIDIPDERQHTGEEGVAQPVALPQLPSVRSTPLAPPTVGDKVVGEVEELIVRAVSQAADAWAETNVLNASATQVITKYHTASSFNEAQEIGVYQSGGKVMSDVASALMAAATPSFFNETGNMPINTPKPASIPGAKPSYIQPPRLQMIKGGVPLRGAAGGGGIGFHFDSNAKMIQIASGAAPIKIPKDIPIGWIPSSSLNDQD